MSIYNYNMNLNYSEALSVAIEQSLDPYQNTPRRSRSSISESNFPFFDKLSDIICSCDDVKSHIAELLKIQIDVPQNLDSDFSSDDVQVHVDDRYDSIEEQDRQYADLIAREENSETEVYDDDEGNEEDTDDSIASINEENDAKVLLLLTCPNGTPIKKEFSSRDRGIDIINFLKTQPNNGMEDNVTYDLRFHTGAIIKLRKRLCSQGVKNRVNIRVTRRE